MMMSNMSYCRFRNTLMDLEDCRDALDGADLEQQEELKERRKLQEARLKELDAIPEFDFTEANEDEYDSLEEILNDEKADILDGEELDAARKLVDLCMEIVSAHYEEPDWGSIGEPS